MSGVIGRIKSAAPLSYTSGFEIFSASNNGGFGLDWITDELMTVKRARRLYISLIISVWQRSGAEREGYEGERITPMRSLERGWIYTRGPGYEARASLIHWGPLTNLFRRPGASYMWP